MVDIAIVRFSATGKFGVAKSVDAGTPIVFLHLEAYLTGKCIIQGIEGTHTCAAKRFTWLEPEDDHFPSCQTKDLETVKKVAKEIGDIYRCVVMDL